MPRTGSGGKGCILNADIRPYRWCTAAAASDDNGHGVLHGRPYKAAPGRRQDSTGCHIPPNEPMWRKRVSQKDAPEVSPARWARASAFPPSAALLYHSMACCVSLGTPFPLS